MAEHTQSAAGLLKAMAHPSRLKVLCALCDGELSVGELNARIDLSQSALSQHLSVLRQDQLVSTRRESQSIFYSLQAGPALAIIQVLHAHYCHVDAPDHPRD